MIIANIQFLAGASKITGFATGGWNFFIAKAFRTFQCLADASVDIMGPAQTDTSQHGAERSGALAA